MLSLDSRLARRALQFVQVLAALALVVAAVAALASGVAAHHQPGHGGGPGGGGGEEPTPTPPPTALDGTIYYTSDADNLHYRIDPDGANNQPVSGLPSNPGPGTPYMASDATHNGLRWFARRADAPSTVFADGYASDLVVYPEGGGTAVQLTDSEATGIRMHTERTIDWTVDPSNLTGNPDAYISYAATRWVDSDPTDSVATLDLPVETGIYRAALTFDGSGAITGLVAEPLTPVLQLTTGDRVVDALAWSPDASSVAYAFYDGNLMVASANGGSWTHTEVFNASVFLQVVWSPDGNRLAFSGTHLDSRGRSVGGLWTVAPDGASLTRLVDWNPAKNNKQSSFYARFPAWSPDSSHIAYEHIEAPPIPSSWIHSLRRIAADGTGDAALAADGKWPSWGGSVDVVH